MSTVWEGGERVQCGIPLPKAGSSKEWVRIASYCWIQTRCCSSIAIWFNRCEEELVLEWSHTVWNLSPLVWFADICHCSAVQGGGKYSRKELANMEHADTCDKGTAWMGREFVSVSLWITHKSQPLLPKESHFLLPRWLSDKGATHWALWSIPHGRRKEPTSVCCPGPLYVHCSICTHTHRHTGACICTRVYSHTEDVKAMDLRNTRIQFWPQ